MAQNYRRNEGANAENEIRRVIGPDEKLIWFGRPVRQNLKKAIFGGSHQDHIISIFLFSIGLVLSFVSTVPTPFAIVLILFALLNTSFSTLFRIINHYAGDPKYTFYGLTDKYLVIVVKRPRRYNVDRLRLEQLSFYYGDEPDSITVSSPKITAGIIQNEEYEVTGIADIEKVLKLMVDTRQILYDSIEAQETIGFELGQPRAHVKSSANAQPEEKDNHAALEIRQLIPPGEKLLWAGRPVEGNILFKSDSLYLWLKLFFGLFAVILNIFLFPLSGLWFFNLFLIFILVAGIYSILHGFVWNGLLKGRVYYGVTTRRLIIVSGLLRRYVKSLNLLSLRNVLLNEKADGTGTIAFFLKHRISEWTHDLLEDFKTASSNEMPPLPAEIRAMAASYRGQMNMAAYNAGPRFELISNARHVYQTILDAHKSLSKPGETQNEDKEQQASITN